MIRYRLICREGHEFEAWFAGSTAYEEQRADGRVTCPQCGSADVAKALMAPSVSTSRSRAGRDVAKDTEKKVPVAGQRSLPPEAMALLREFREKVTAEAEYVGPQFAEEARKIHYGEREETGIYGEAAPDEVESLNEEGIEVLPLPVLPEDRN
jgi:hypothetical protein